jgi:hypothetical protein
VFTKKDGTLARHTVSLTAGENVRIDAPDKYGAIAKADPPKADPPKADPPKKVDPPKVAIKIETKEPVEKTEPVKPKQPKVAKQPDPEVRVDGGRRSSGMGRTGLVVVGGVAATFAVIANNDFNKAIDGGCDGDGNCPVGSPAVDLAQRSNDRARVAQITAIGAGALIATGVTLWVLGRSKTARKSNMAVHVGHTPESSNAALSWRW